MTADARTRALPGRLGRSALDCSARGRTVVNHLAASRSGKVKLAVGVVVAGGSIAEARRLWRRRAAHMPGDSSHHTRRPIAVEPVGEVFVPPSRVSAEYRLAAHAFLAGDEVPEMLGPALNAAVRDLEPSIQDLIDLARRRGPESRAWDNVRRLLASRIAVASGDPR